MPALSVSPTLESGWKVKMPKRVAPLNAMQVEKIKPGEELIDGAVPGLRLIRTAAGLSWGLSVRVRGVRRWIRVGVGIGLADARTRADRLARTSPTARTRLKSSGSKAAPEGRC